MRRQRAHPLLVVTFNIHSPHKVINATIALTISGEPTATPVEVQL